MRRPGILVIYIVVVALAILGVWGTVGTRAVRRAETEGAERAAAGRPRDRLFAELQPIRLANCDLQRFGEAADGGYLMCANLLGAVQSAYSYGISGYDKWGCDISTRHGVPVHQYDCFDATRPACPGGEMLFHAECVAGRTFTDREGRPFDTVANQLRKNGHGGKRIVVKMDVEGSEWDAILETPDAVFERIDQLAIELHDFEGDVARYLEAVAKLKKHFYVAHLHFNNYSCMPGLEPFPASAYEVLFVSRRLAVPARAMPVRLPHRADRPNNPNAPDCQAPAAAR